MRLELVDQRSLPGDLPRSEPALAELLTDVGDPGWRLNLVLVEDHVMADLYARWYGGDGVTDVLSFSYLEEDGTGEPHLARGSGDAARDLWVAPGDCGDDITVGEVILAPAFIAGRCAREGWDLKTEWALLLVHGALHVLGWRHDDPDQRRAMRVREAELLARCGIAHPLPTVEMEE